jgi:hypothetical protein
MTGYDFDLPPESARRLFSELLDLSAQVRVDAEQQRQNVRRFAPGSLEQPESRGHARALEQIVDLLDRLVIASVPADQYQLVRYQVEAEAARRLRRGQKRDEQAG